MSEQTNPTPADDSLDSVERVIAIEETLNQIVSEWRLSLRGFSELTVRPFVDSDVGLRQFQQAAQS